MKEYRFLLYIISTLFVIEWHHAEELENNVIDAKSSSAEVSSGNIVGKGQALKGEDKQRTIEKYRKGLLKELLNGFEIKKPVKAIEENKRSFIKYIKEKRKGFFYYCERIISCFCLGFYSACLKKDVDDLLENPRPYYEEPYYKENQKSIDDYDRFEAIKRFMSFFLKMYSPSAASLKNCSNIFTKIDNIIHSCNDEGGGSVLSDVGFRLYIYECMSKFRISPEEACEKLKDVPAEEIQYITQILDELQASEEDFLRSFYDNTSLLQQYGLEDCATCEGEDKWKVDNMLFTMEGSTTGGDDTKISIQSRFNFTNIFKNFFSIVLPVALAIFVAYYVLSRGKDTKETFIRQLGFFYLTITCFFNSIFVFISSKVLLYKLLWPCVLLLTSFACFVLGLGECKKKDSRAYTVLYVTLLIIFLLSVLNVDKIIFYWLNLLFYDRDTLLTEYLIVRRNDAISRYIKALLSLHTRILNNPFLRDLFKNEIKFFYSFCLDNAVDDKRERTFKGNIAACIDYFRNYKQDISLIEVLSADFDSNYSNISFMLILNQIKEILAILAFNAAKIRANIRLFKNEDLRAAVISALK